MKKLLEYTENVLAYKKCQTIFFAMAIVLFIGVLWFDIFAATGCLADTVEHIQASWLVGEGKVPYRDFFEHHNPLLWYLFAPVTQLFFQNIFIFPIAKGLGAIGYLVIIWLSYIINRDFIYGKKSAQFSVLILLSVPYLWHEATTLRPDIFMSICFLGAVYYFLSYLKKKTLKNLVLSYLLIIFSFLFLQKIVFIGIGFLLLNLYYLYKKQIRRSDFICAGLIGLSPLLIFLYLLFISGAIQDWFYYNFEFNILMKKYYQGYTSGYTNLLPIITLLSAVVVFRYHKQQRELLSWEVFYLFSIFSIIIFAPHPQYYLLYWVFASVLLGNILDKAKYFKLIYLLLIVAFYMNIYRMFPTNNNRKFYASYQNNLQYLWKNVTKPEDFLSLTKVTYNVFIPNQSYYWFGMHNVVIIDTIHNIKQNFDLKDVLEKQKPQYIAYRKNIFPNLNDMLVYEKSKYFINRNNNILRKSAKYPEFLSHLIVVDSDFWQIDEKWIEKNYKPVKQTELWELKTLE